MTPYHALGVFAFGAGVALFFGRWSSESVRFCDDVPAPFEAVYCGSTLSAGRNPATGEMMVATSWRSSTEHSLGAVETWLNPHQSMSLPYIEAMVNHALSLRPQHVLVLGLGGGAIPFLLNQFCRNCNVTAVDIAQDALQITRQFVHADDGIYARYIRSDAVDFIQSAGRATFDVVMDDVYVGHQRPPAMQSLRFLKRLHSVIKPHGRYIANFCTPMSASSPLIDVIEYLQKVFHKVYEVPLPETQNTIIIAGKA